jgi:predicted permease
VNDVIGELLPVFILIVLGYLIRVTRILSSEQFGHVNRFGYFILYPAFLFMLSSQADLSGGDTGSFLLGILAGVTAMTLITLAIRPFFGAEGPAYTSVFQGAVRWNGFVLFASAEALYGPQGLHYVAIAFGPLVLIVNLICVIVLARWGDGRGTGWRAILDQIIVNPLIIGCAAGLSMQAIGVREFGPAGDVLEMLAAAAMPIALMCVGAGLDFKAVRAARLKVGVATGMRLLLAPIVMWSAATAIGASPLSAAIAAGIGSTPTAAAAYPLAREMGGDAQLMAAIITMTTIVSFITMPIAIGLALP